MTKNFVKSTGILVAIAILAACMIATAVQGNLIVAAGLFIAFICTAVFADSVARAAKFNASKYAKLEAINEGLNEETNKYRVNAANAQKALDESHAKCESLQAELHDANVKLDAAINEQNKLNAKAEKLEVAEQTLDNLRADIANKDKRIAALEQSYNEMVELANNAAKKTPVKRATKRTTAKKASEKASAKKTED